LGFKGSDVGADGVEWFTRKQAARALGIGESTLRLWHDSGSFLPDENRKGVYLYSLKQLNEKRRELPGELAALAFEHFERGMNAVQVVIALRADPGVIGQLYDSYVRMTSAWVVAGPVGSKAAWEATYRVGPITAMKIRRALELCSADPKLREKLLSE
jgi:hypothetical protein